MEKILFSLSLIVLIFGKCCFSMTCQEKVDELQNAFDDFNSLTNSNSQIWSVANDSICGFPENSYSNVKTDAELATICNRAKEGPEALLLCCLLDRFTDNKLHYRPANNYSQMTFISLSFKIFDLLPIDELNQVMQTRGKLLINWDIDFIKWHGNPLFPDKGDNRHSVTINHRKTGLWIPNVLHINNAQSVQLVNEIADSTDVIVNSDGAAELTIIGIFESRCALQLRNWPFDQQTCSFDFQLGEDPSLVQVNPGIQLFSSIYCETADGVCEYPKSIALWEYVSDSIQRINQCREDYMFRYTVTLARRPLMFFFTIIGPSVLGAILQLTTFMIPFYRPERANYSVVITLTFTVLQLSVKSLIPKSTQLVILVIYLLGLFGLGTIVTIHSVLLFSSYHCGPREIDADLVLIRAKKEGRLNPFAVDALVGVLVLIISLGLHFLLFGVAWLKVVTF